METAIFRTAGGPISAEVSVGFAPESMFYNLRLFSPQKKKALTVAAEVDFEQGPNTYVLPGLNSDKDKRVVGLFAQLAGLSVGDPYRVELTIFQNGERIGGDAVEKKAADVSAFEVIEIRLIKAES